ncbi:LOW QUALITY PROTEIN: sushi, von Willebrand factor type A, EGF and pentraxin domain-containing protein 1-like [Panulirus ornatus]|uniref:LOW QUALITY PROTEIN: sushi, von Willebrand factor type A, EGF and pentraxin domain-containing protein 1-like n=1 Tax=Panulirus ornatus TaxID=150431 RepID=UPI003A891679
MKAKRAKTPPHEDSEGEGGSSSRCWSMASVLVALSLVLLVAECDGGRLQRNRRTRYTDAAVASGAYAYHNDDETMEGRKIYLNPRNAPSDSCPRDEEAIARMGRTCLRKCSTDADCLSRRKVCLCDGVCGLSCIKPDKECVDLDNPHSGYVDVKGKIVGSVATYRCQEGYHLIGQAERHCQANGIWTSAPPECRENLYCTDPPVIPFARHNGMQGQTRFEVNQTLQYSCYEGYTTRGFDVAKCFLYNNTMQWFGPEIQCEPKTCGDPGEILNGFKEGSCFTFSCRVTYQCRPGFELVGRSNYYCQHDGAWSPHELPTCSPVQCDIPENPENGKAIFIAVSYNAVVSYECDYGFMIVGSTTRRCGPDKKWSGVKPICKQIDCGHPGYLSNGWLDNIEQGTALGASVIFRCYPNMTIEGDQSTVCQADGSWSKPLPMCLAPCIVPTIEHGKLRNETRTGAQVPHGSTIDVECDENYELAYSLAPSLCYNGTWTNYPRCQPARCKKLPDRPRHGMVIAPKTDHGKKARYRCKDGYQLQGPTTTRCHYGNWTSSKPSCQEVYCPFPGELEHGRVLLVGNMGMYDYRSYVKKVRNNRQLRFACNRGYFLVEGPPGATCVHGRWSPKEIPRCEPDLHPRVRWIKRSVNSSDYFENLNTTMEESLTDYPTATLSASTTVVDDNDEGRASSEVAQVADETDESEEEDHHLPNDNELRDPIASEEEWTSVTPATTVPTVLRTRPAHDLQAVLTSRENHGKEETSSESRSLPSGHVVDFGHPKSSEAKTIASMTTKLRGPPRRFLRLLRSENGQQAKGLEIGSWPSLVRVPRNVAEKEKKDKKHKRRNKWKKKGKRDSPAVPHCEPIPSEPYLRVEVARKGRDSNYTYSAGARIKVTCLHGYGLNIGNRTAKCARRGKWKPMKPECVTLPCSVPEASHGQFEFSGVALQEKAVISHGEVVKFSCQTGFNILGSDTMRCWYGAWAVTGKNPECIPNNCMLPELSHGKYTAGYKKGLIIIHGASVEYTCDDGWVVSVPDVTCYLGMLSPAPPACVTPAQTREVVINSEAVATVKRGGAEINHSNEAVNEDGLTTGGDIDDVALTSSSSTAQRSMCPFPEYVPGSRGFIDGHPLDDKDEMFPDGTTLTFNCKTNNIGVKTTWDMTCVDGAWQGRHIPSTCSAEGADEEQNFGNKSCTWRKSEPNVVTFYDDKELTEEVMEFTPGAQLVSRCVDIGKFALIGDTQRRCIDGVWTGDKPACVGLNQENDYSVDKAPTILFRNERGPMAQSNDGKLVVYPGTVLHLECLFERRHGTPKWNVSLSSTQLLGKKRRRKSGKKAKGGGKLKAMGSMVPYPNGWAIAPGRNMQLEYRLSIFKAQEKDSGAYACETPMGHKHIVMVEIKAVHCPDIATMNKSDELTSLRYDPVDDTRMSTVVRFSCVPGSSLVGAQQTKCLPSGNWSSRIPRCESKFEEDKCTPPAPPLNGMMTGEGPFHAGDVVEVKCSPNYMMEGQPFVVCQEDGQWSDEVPKCLLACTYPGTIISGTMTSIKFYYPINDTITYTCSSGFVLHGARSIVCREGGRWSAPVPTCLPRP